MKRFLYLSLFIGLILPPALCGASYLIEFKSGSKFVTSHYWTTGSQVNFYSRGGVMGVPKTMIKNISATDQSPELEVRAQPEQKVKEKDHQASQDEIEIQSKEQIKATTPEPKAEKDMDVEALKKKKADLEEKVEYAKQIYSQVTKNGNSDEIQTVLREFLKHRDALVQYQKEILEQNNNLLPNWW